MLIIESLAAILTLWCVYLTTKRNIWQWPIGIWAVVLYAIVFLNARLYADFILQGFFAIQGVIGFIVWYQNREVNRSYIIKVERLTNKQRGWFIAFTVAAYFVIAYIFKHYTNASLPYIDSLAALLSLAANQLLVKRKIESWYLWIAVDLIYIGMFLYKGLIVSSGLYVILLFLAIKGFYEWRKKVA
jgi:nicotinamide mononucleotide transporter